MDIVLDLASNKKDSFFSVVTRILATRTARGGGEFFKMTYSKRFGKLEFGH